MGLALGLQVGCGCCNCCGSRHGACPDNVIDYTAMALDDNWNPTDAAWPTFLSTHDDLFGGSYFGEIVDVNNPDLVVPDIGRVVHVTSGMIVASTPKCCDLTAGRHLLTHYIGSGLLGVGPIPDGALLQLYIQRRLDGPGDGWAVTTSLFDDPVTLLASGPLPAGPAIPEVEVFVFPDGSGELFLNNTLVYSAPAGIIPDVESAWLGLSGISIDGMDYLSDARIGCPFTPPLDSRVTTDGDTRTTTGGDTRIVSGISDGGPDT